MDVAGWEEGAEDEGSCETAGHGAEDLQDLLRSSEGDPGLVVTRVQASPACRIGDNYTSSVTRVEVAGTTSKGSQERMWSLIVKREPANPATRVMLRTNKVFLNETAAYSGVLRSFQRFFGDSLEALRVPRCLHAANNPGGAVIVLEDLRPAGFVMQDRHAGLDLDHCRLALQELARYHSLSMAMKRLDSETFQRTSDQIREVIYVPEAAHLFGPSLENACRMAIGGLHLLSAGDQTLQRAIGALERYRGRIFKLMSLFVQPSEPFSVISHGDFWINNMMFSYKEQDGRMSVEDVRLLDLQVARYCSPAVDILHFLYTSTFREVRRRHRDELLRAYHESLDGNFRRLVKGTPLEDQHAMSLDELLREVHERELYGLFNGMWIMTAVTADVNNIPDLDTVRLEDFCSEKSLENWIAAQTPSYRRRTRDLVLEYYEKGII